MGFGGPYRLEIRTITPEIVNVDEEFQIRYQIKNITEVPYPGGNIAIQMFYASIGKDIIVNHPMQVPPLQPDAIEPFDFNERPLVSGMIAFFKPHVIFTTGGHQIELYHPNGNLVPNGQLLHAVRVRSPEELSQSEIENILAETQISTQSLADSSERLVEGSDRLEKLTWALIILTFILILMEILSKL